MVAALRTRKVEVIVSAVQDDVGTVTCIRGTNENPSATKLDRTPLQFRPNPAAVVNNFECQGHPARGVRPVHSALLGIRGRVKVINQRHHQIVHKQTLLTKGLDEERVVSRFRQEYLRTPAQGLVVVWKTAESGVITGKINSSVDLRQRRHTIELVTRRSAGNVEAFKQQPIKSL